MCLTVSNSRATISSMLNSSLSDDFRITFFDDADAIDVFFLTTEKKRIEGKLKPWQIDREKARKRESVKLFDPIDQYL